MKKNIMKALAVILTAALTASACSGNNVSVQDTPENITAEVSDNEAVTADEDKEVTLSETDPEEAPAETEATTQEESTQQEEAPADDFNPNREMFLKKPAYNPELTVGKRRDTGKTYFFCGSDIVKSFDGYTTSYKNLIGTTFVINSNELWLIKGSRCELIDTGDITGLTLAKTADIVYYFNGNTLCMYDGTVTEITKAGYMTYEGDPSGYENIDPDKSADELSTEELVYYQGKQSYDYATGEYDIKCLSVSCDGSVCAWIGNCTFYIDYFTYSKGDLCVYRKGDSIKTLAHDMNYIYSVSDGGDFICTFQGTFGMEEIVGTLYAFTNMSEEPQIIDELACGGVSPISSFDGSHIMYYDRVYYTDSYKTCCPLYIYGKNTPEPIPISEDIYYVSDPQGTIFTPSDSFYALNDFDRFYVEEYTEDSSLCLKLFNRKDDGYESKIICSNIGNQNLVLSDDSEYFLYIDAEKNLCKVRADGSGQPIKIASDVDNFKANGDFTSIYYRSCAADTKHYIYLSSGNENDSRLFLPSETYTTMIGFHIEDVLFFMVRSGDNMQHYYSENGDPAVSLSDNGLSLSSWSYDYAFFTDGSGEYYITYDGKNFTPTGIYEDKR